MKTLISLVPIVARIAVPLIALAIGLGTASTHVGWLLKRPALLWKSLLSVLLVVPALAVVLVRYGGLAPPVAVGLLLVVVAVGPVVAVKKVNPATGDPDFAVGLSLLLLAVGIVWVPLAVFGIGSFFHRELELPFAAVAKVILPMQLLPLFLGLVIGRFAPKFAAVIEKPLRIGANLAFLACVVVVLVAFAKPAASLGLDAYLCIGALAVGSIAIGHLLGGPGTHTRPVLAAFSSMRFPALAFALAGLTAQGTAVVPTVLVYVVFNAVALATYSALMRLSAGHGHVTASPHMG